MTTTLPPTLEERHLARMISALRVFAPVAGIGAVALGLLVLLGWSFDLTACKSVLPGQATMKANTALAFVGLGAALVLFRRGGRGSWPHWAGGAGACLAMLLATLTLAEYLAARDLGIDQWVFHDPFPQEGLAFPGRMAPATACGILLLGTGLLALEARRWLWLAQALLLAAMAVGLLALVGYLYGVSSLYSMGGFNSVALHTAVTFLVLGAGILCLRPDEGLLGLLTSNSMGGHVARRLVPVAILMPLFLGWLRLTGQRAGLYDMEFGLALFALSNVVLFTVVIFWNAAALRRADQERLQAGTLLREREEQFRLFVEYAPAAIAMFDTQMRYLVASQRWQADYGLTGQPLRGRCHYDVFPDMPERWQEIHRRCLAGAVVRLEEDAFVRSDGSVQWLRWEIRPWHAAAGTIGGILIFAEDITARKQADAALLAANAKLQHVLASSPAVLYSLKLDGDTVTSVWVSDNVNTLLGYAMPPTWNASWWLDSLQPQDREAGQLQLPDLLQRGHLVSEYRFRHQDGTYRWIRDEKRLLRDDQDRPTECVGSWTDITERKQAEQMLLTSEERFRQAFDCTSVAMVLTDLNNRFVRANTAFAHLFGYSETDILQLSMADITHPDDVAESYARREALLAGSTAYFQMEKRYLHKDGHLLWGLTNVALVRDASGVPQEYVGQVQDITERKRAAEANAQYIERLRILHQIDRALVAGDGPAAIAGAALPPLRELLGVARVVVNLFDLSTGQVEWLAAAGRRRVHVGPGIRYSLRFMGDVEALGRGEVQTVDVHALPPGPEVDTLLASGVHAYLVVPMIARGELIGALSLGDTSQPLSAEQVGIAREAAAQFAIAIAQARLHERVQQQAHELEGRVVACQLAEDEQRRLASERDQLLSRLRLQIERSTLR